MAQKPLETTVLKGKDKQDLDKQEWDLRATGVTIDRIWPDESIPLRLTTPKGGEKIMAQDTVSRRIDYYKK